MSQIQMQVERQTQCALEEIVRVTNMPARLLLAPAAASKTQYAIARIQSLRHENPLATIWVIVPNTTNVKAFKRRLADAGGAIGVRLGTFYALYEELLAEAGQLVARLDEPVIHRFLRDCIADLYDEGVLSFFANVRDKPGFIRAIHTAIQELKRARIVPEQFEESVRGRSERLQELARVYGAYQRRLLDADWVDGEGQGWLAARALERNARPARDWRLLIVDGFDEFDPTQLEVLRLLAARVGETLITLTGTDPSTPLRSATQKLPLTPTLSPLGRGGAIPSPLQGEGEGEGGVFLHLRMAHRRFARARAALESNLTLSYFTLSRSPSLPVTPLTHLEASLFEHAPRRMQSDNVIEFIETPNRAEETRTALRWLKARLVRDHCAPGEVALLARNVEPYRAFIEETAAEFGMPIYLSEGANLAENPAIAALLNLLTLPLKDFPRRAVVDAWHSPYADWSAQRIEPGDAERLDAAARWGQVIAGRAQWEDTLTRLARATRAALLAQAKSDEETAPLTAPIGPAASALWSKFQTFAARLTPPSQATLCDYTAWIEALIGDDPALLTEWQAESDVSLGVVRCARAEAATRERDVAALRAFKDVLRALVFAESALNKSRQLSFAEFLAELSGAVQAARYRVPPLDETETILVASVLTARGLSFCAVALVGLAEGEFPQPASEDPLLGEADRSALSLAPRLVGDEVTIFYEAVTRARERLLLTRPYLADDGQPWEPSPYWVHVQRLLDAPTRRVRPEDALPLEDAASAPELLTLLPLPPLPSPERPERSEGSGEGRGGWGVRGEAVRVGVQVLAAHATDEARGPHDGDLTACRAHLARAFPSTRPWSASRLETYGACPFAFFIVEVLGLEARPPAEAGFDVRQLGTMYHAILEQLLRDALDPTDLDALLARLPPICRAIFDAAPETYGFRPTALWQQQRAELERILADTLRALAEASEGWRPRYFELAYGKDDAAPLVLRGDEGSEIRLRGYIDRVDVNDAGELRVVDYKAGSTPISKDDLGEGRRLQLPLYARALRDALKIGTPVAGMYWHIGAAKASSFKLEKYPGGVDAALETAARHALAYVSRVANGDFASRAPDDGCPAWCPATAFCWRYKPKRK